MKVKEESGKVDLKLNIQKTKIMASSPISSVQSLSHVQLFATPWIAACQASLSITNSQSLPKPMSIESVMPSSHLILCRPLLLLPPILPSIRVFSKKLTLCIRWPKYWSFSFSIIPSKEILGLISFRMDWLNLLATYCVIFQWINIAQDIFYSPVVHVFKFNSLLLQIVL